MRPALVLALLACACGPTEDPHWTVARLVRREGFDPEMLFPFAKTSCVYDAEAGLLLPPNHTENWTWPEHEGGTFRMHTNNLGLVEDADTESAKHGLRILCVGDSHLMVVGSEEAFPNVLERKLRAAGYPQCEVLNAAVGYTGPRLYLKRVERYLALDPDVVLVSFFSGNDLWDDFLLTYDVGASPRPLLGREYQRRLERCRESHSGALFQGLDQAHFFKHWPGTDEVALALALESLERIHALCEREGMLMLVVILPTKVAVDVEDEPEVRADALATLELSEEEAAVNVRLAARLAGALAERGIPCLDPTAAMRADPRPFFWRKDHHLSVAGQDFVAAALFEAFEPVLAAHGWREAR
jgi:hypothetical protein